MINLFLPLLNILTFNESIVVLNNPLVESLKKKASHLWGRVMGNLIFKPISKKMQPPICSAIKWSLTHY